MRKRYSRSYTVLSFLTMFSYREHPSACLPFLVPVAGLRVRELKTCRRHVFCGLRAAVLFESDRYEKFLRPHTGPEEFVFSPHDR